MLRASEYLVNIAEPIILSVVCQQLSTHLSAAKHLCETPIVIVFTLPTA